MLAVFPTCSKDVKQLKELFTWIHDLGGCKHHECLIVCDPETPWDSVLDCRKEAEKSFDEVAVIADDQHLEGWPQGANSLFRKAAGYIHRKVGKPFLWMEPDAIPLKPGWLDLIHTVYCINSKPFLGHIYECNQKNLPERLMSAIAVYPSDALTVMNLSQNSSRAFDVDAAYKMVANGRDNALIHHIWGQPDNPPVFADQNVPGTSVFCLKQIPPEAVIWHRNKDGSLIRLLRKQMNLPPPKSVRRLVEPVKKQCFIQGGRFGDLIILLPAMLRHYEHTGVKPVLISSTEFSNVLDGVSYVESLPLHFDWWRGMPQMRQVAEREFGGGIVTQCYAHGWGLGAHSWPDFMTSMLDRAGLPIADIPSAKLMFDKRSPSRESELLKKFRKTNKPLLLLNFTGHSSPFKHTKEVMAVVNRYESKFEILNLGSIRASRIYDLLALFDIAAGAILTDSSTYHLAHASKAPYIGFLMHGWTGSIKRDSCSLAIRYDELPGRINEIFPFLEDWK